MERWGKLGVGVCGVVKGAARVQPAAACARETATRVVKFVLLRFCLPPSVTRPTQRRAGPKHVVGRENERRARAAHAKRATRRAHEVLEVRAGPRRYHWSPTN